MAKKIARFVLVGFWLVGLAIAAPGASSAQAAEAEGPLGVAVDNMGNVYVSGGGVVQKFDRYGGFLSQLPGKYSRPVALKTDRQDSLYIADSGGNYVYKINTVDGYSLGTWGTGLQSTSNGYLSQPSAVAVNNAGELYVADTRNSRVQKFNQTGQFLLKWGTPGEDSGEFNAKGVYGLAIDTQNSVFVADPFNHRIQKFDRLGQYLSAWNFGRNATDSSEISPLHLAIDFQDNIYFTDMGHRNVYKFDKSGRAVAGWNTRAASWSDHLEGIAVNAQGEVFVADNGAGQIVKLNSNGSVISKWAWKGGPIAYQSRPTPPVPTTISSSMVTSPLEILSALTRGLTSMAFGFLPIVLLVSAIAYHVRKGQVRRRVAANRPPFSPPPTALPVPGQEATSFTQAIRLAQVGQKADAYGQFKALEIRNPANVEIRLWVAYTAPTLPEAWQAVGIATALAPTHPAVAQAQDWLNRQFPG